MILFMFVRAALCQESRADASGQARPGGSGDASSVGSAKHDCGVASEPMAAQIMLIMDAWAPKAQRGARILVARNNAIQRMELGHNGQMSLVELATPAGELGIMDDRVVLVTWTNPETKFGRFVHMKATTAVFSMGRHHKMRSMHDATIIHPAVGAQMVKAKDLQRSMSQLPDDILVLKAMWECCLAAQATMENTNFDTCIACDQNGQSCQTCGLCQLTLHPACLERAFADTVVKHDGLQGALLAAASKVQGPDGWDDLELPPPFRSGSGARPPLCQLCTAWCRQQACQSLVVSCFC